MSVEWMPLFVLPNIELKSAIGCDIAALVPANDHRIAALKRTHPMFKRFLNRFADNFGQKFEPAVLIRATTAPSKFREVGAPASFRDLVALSVITHGRALELVRPRRDRVRFGETFAIYPWMLDRNYEDLIGKTPAILGIHMVSSFKGQSSPALARTPVGRRDIDQPLFDALMARWLRHYEAEQPEWADVALMRSLNMAYQASLMPGGTDTTFYDVGRVVALWVSAFEILVHPGGEGRANRDKVFDLIEQTPWAIQDSGKPAYDTGSKNKVKRTLASWLYQKLYDCRIDFLHGNPVKHSTLFFDSSPHSIIQYAAPLYRIALTAFLPLTCDRPKPSVGDTDYYGAYLANRLEFREPQKNAEKALLTAQPPSD